MVSTVRTRRRRRRVDGGLIRLGLLAIAVVAAACGSTGTAPVTPAPAAPGSLMISPQNDHLTAGRNRLSLVIQDHAQLPILGAAATVEVRSDPATQGRTTPLSFVGADFSDLPIYTGLITLPHAGSWLLLVHVQLASGAHDAGQAFVTAEAVAPMGAASTQLQVGDRMPAIAQPVVGPGVTLSSVDSGIPPDTWHDTTVATGLNAHRPMLVYVGEPGRCLTKTCGDMIVVLQRLCTSVCTRMLFEHIEVHNPADSAAFSPAWLPFHLAQEQPWVFLVNADGVIADAFEGPAAPEQLAEAAAGTLAGKVPAV